MDLEMTGLDPDNNVIVEIATIITDDELEIIAEGPDLVIHQPEAELAKMETWSSADARAKRAHWPRSARPRSRLADAGAQTLAFMKEHIARACARCPLCGNSIGTDRRFLARCLPDIEDYLHYRSVDVSTLKELARRWYPDALGQIPSKQGSHRALDDIRESIEELRTYRTLLFRDPASPVAP